MFFSFSETLDHDTMTPSPAFNSCGLQPAVNALVWVPTSVGPVRHTKGDPAGCIAGDVISHFVIKILCGLNNHQKIHQVSTKNRNHSFPFSFFCGEPISVVLTPKCEFCWTLVGLNMFADHVTHIHPAKNNISLRRKILAEEEALYIHMPVSLRGEALGRMVWSWYHFLILKIDMVMSTGMSRLNCVGEESLASSSQENRLEFQHLKWIVIICRKNNPGARKAVYQIGLITPKVKCFCPVILNFVCSSIFLIEDVYSKGRRNFLRLVLQDPSWCM